jgi:signal transduction histidine kinase
MRLGPSAPRVTWCLVSSALLMSCLGLAATIEVGHAERRSVVDMTLNLLVVVGFCVMGVVVASARPGHMVAWLLLIAGFGWAVGNGAIDLAGRAVATGTPLPGGASAYALTGAVVRDIGWYTVVLGLPIYFPTGAVADRSWRWLPRLLGVVMVGAVVNSLVSPTADLAIVGWHNPLAPSGAWRVTDWLSFPLSLPLAVGVAVAALFQLRHRWCTGSLLERRQLALFGLAAGPPVLAGPLSFVPGMPNLFVVTVLPLPFAIGYAVVARGLYDLRTATNRAVVWVVLSAVVAGIYAVVIASVGGVFDLGTVAWLPAVAVGVVAVSFAPLRDALQRTVNRVLYGRWEEPYAVLARLGQRLEATTDTNRLLADACGELTGLGLRGVRVEDRSGEVVASSGDGRPDEPTEEIPLTVYGERVGTLRYSSPTPLRPSDRQLLDDLCVQLGGVVHGRRLTAELQNALESVVLAREEERRRLRRDLHDGLGPALAGHLLRLDVVAREVEPGSRVADLVDSLREELRATVVDVRRVVEGLRPPALDELGLDGALAQAVQRLTAGTLTEVELVVSDLPQLPAATEVAAFRIVTEAVTNVVRHAHAPHCRVTVEVCDGCLRLEIADDGAGLPDRPGTGNGLSTMRERAEEMRGSLQVVSAAGTRVLAQLPIGHALLAEAVRT